jgi:phytoene dehydrogenase-like protein
LIVHEGRGERAYDAVVVGSGPNGLAAAITIAQRQRSVLVLEAQPTLGGGARSAELTLPGYLHDVCSAIHPMGVASPFFRSLPLDEHGLAWIHPPAPLAHPLDDGSAVMLERDVAKTASLLGNDERAYERLMGPLVQAADAIFHDALGPLAIPRAPVAMIRLAIRAARSASGLATSWFREPRAKALLAGLAGHSILPLEKIPSAAVAVMLGLAGHAVGWPLPRGGSQAITDALASYLRALGGELRTNCRVESLADLPPAKAYLFDLAPRNVARICRDSLPSGFRARLERFRHGPGIFKLDWALSQPIPWRSGECLRAATAHLGGTLEEIAASERDAWHGKHSDKPYVLLAQQSLFDVTRAPAGKQTGWAYCHVPAGSTVDMTEAIESQVERFAPGFRDCIVGRSEWKCADVERHNANCIGGDISGGVMDLWQLFTRPTARLVPYSTPNPKIFICSASTPPGAGVHGMCGYFAAQAALRTILK